MHRSGALLMGFLLACAPGLAAPARPDAAGTGYGRIEVLRDTWGVAHVFADTDAGAMYGLGYACAEDRAFQMYYSLRIIQGRLAEVVGDRPSSRRNEPATLNDRRMRTFGFYRAAQAAAAALDPDSAALLAAYSHGVNDYIAAHRADLHPLFAQLGLEPEAWTPADCIASFWHLGQFFAGDGTRELLQYRNIASGAATRPVTGRDGRTITPPVATPAWMDDSAAVVGRSDVSDEWVKQVEQFVQDKGLTPTTTAPSGPAGPRFSHAWVVGGKKTTTGSAVLVSDPQTPVRAPSIWQEYHVSGKTFNARGVGVPGCPGFIIGWNENVAWGATALGADQADLFRLQTDADHPDQYLLDGTWRQMDVRHETIRVKDGAPVDLDVRETVFGPIITAFAFPAPGDPEVALKRVPVCSIDTGTLRAMLGMMRSRDALTFADALATWQFPSINIVFGDRAGNIGYWLLAAVPIRSALDAQHGGAAVDGARSSLDWQGFIPHDMLPHVMNPERGWIASANHRAIGTFYPMALGLSTGSAGHSLRSWRLYERLTAREKFAPADVLDIHLDTVNAARREIVHAGLHLRDALKRELTPNAAAALARLQGWYARGAHSDLTDEGAELAGEINTFFRIMATPLAANYGGGESGLSRCLRDLAQRIAKDRAAELSADEQQFIDQTLAGAWTSALNKFGDDPAQWSARARSGVTNGRIGAFDSLDGFGSLDRATDLSMPALTCVDGGTIKSQGSQSYTQYVPLHDVDAALSLLPPGQSERASDPRRTSGMELWAKGQLHAAPLTRPGVEKIVTSRATLAPTRARSGTPR